MSTNDDWMILHVVKRFLTREILNDLVRSGRHLSIDLHPSSNVLLDINRIVVTSTDLSRIHIEMVRHPVTR